MSELVVLETVLEVESEELIELTKDIDITNIDIDELDKPLTKVDIPLTELSDEMRVTLRDKGYSEEVIERIGSEQEAQIYLDAGLECETVNGKDVLAQPDIDPDQMDEVGRTNLERMEKGLPPQDSDGKPYQLHHIGQNADSPLAELTQSEHMGGGNNKILHDVTKDSEIDRSDFKTERTDHWKQRAEEIKNQRSEAAV
ncbi:HNH/ENDO VII family nuclease [Serratia sp. ASV30]|uniref:HNH/ENDO VII family nuclease n=1 Tax=Serratia sp. ASV30 TaxID=2795127 RepID=UPI0018ED7F13|nr:HNH/ENDO VII family nuclease [Serratia sp. ASV30]